MSIPSASSASIEPLVDLGFTGAEAEVYIFLLSESPASAYRIAQVSGKPAAQTYRALESLARRGAVLVAEDKTRLWRAVPLDACLDNLQRTFFERRARAAEQLRRLPRPSSDHRVYRLTSPGHVIEQCRALLKSAKQIALIDVFPVPFRDLKDDIEKLVERKVSVAVKLYEDIELDGATLRVVAGDRKEVLDRWIGEQINLVIDGREFLSALLTKDGRGVHYAFWSANPYLSAMSYNGLICEMTLSLLSEGVREGAGESVLQAVLERCQPLYLSKSPVMEAIARPDVDQGD